MCGSACLPGGGAGSPARPLTSSPQVGQELPSSHHERPQEVTGRGGVRALSPAELPSRPGLRRFGSRDPPAPRKLLPSSPHPLQGAQTPEPCWRPGPGDSQGGGQCREVPRPLHFPVTPTGKLSHRLPPSPVTSAGRDPPQIPTPIRGKEPQPPRNRPAPLETSPGAFAAPGRVLPLFLALMAGGSCQRSWHSSWAGKEQISTSVRLSFPTQEVLMYGPSHFSLFPWRMSSSHSHMKDENNPGNHPNAHQ